MADPLREAQRFFAPRAQAYRESRSHGNEAELARMLSVLGDVTGKRALDVATGGGHTARALRDTGASAVACDATREMLVAPWPAAQCDALRLPFRASTFDLVASRIAPHHFTDLHAFCHEAARVLAPGGRLYVFDLTSPEDAEAARVVDRIERLRDPSHVWSHSLSQWRAAIEASGLVVERLELRASEFDLEPWIARAGMTPEAEAGLRALLAAHPAESLAGYGLTPQGMMRVLRVEVLARREAMDRRTFPR